MAKNKSENKKKQDKSKQQAPHTGDKKLDGPNFPAT
jgi:hypothetical protein